MMKFSDLYENGMKLWPEAIHIGDGYPTGRSGYMFPTLTAIHDKIEEQLSEEDGWASVIDWSLFQAFHAKSKMLIARGEKTLLPRSVEPTEIEWRVRENLTGYDWKSFLAEYVNDLQST